MKWFPVSFLLVICLGCGDAGSIDAPARDGVDRKPTAKTKRKAPPPKKKEAPKPPPKAVFRDCDDALVALSKALAADDKPQIKAVSTWLVRQGKSGVGPLTRTMNDAAATMEDRVTACRLLTQIGPPAMAVLLAALTSDVKLIRMKSAESLGKAKPVQAQTVNALIQRLDQEKDLQVRRIVIHALGEIGEPAKAAAPRLLAILNTPGSETLRSEASWAIRQVEPRRTLPQD